MLWFGECRTFNSQSGRSSNVTTEPRHSGSGQRSTVDQSLWQSMQRTRAPPSPAPQESQTRGLYSWGECRSENLRVAVDILDRDLAQLDVDQRGVESCISVIKGRNEFVVFVRFVTIELLPVILVSE